MKKKSFKSHLQEPTLSCMVQGGSAGAVRHVQVAQLGQQGLCTTCGTVGSGHMQWGLPEFVSCVCICSTS